MNDLDFLRNLSRVAAFSLVDALSVLEDAKRLRASHPDLDTHAGRVAFARTLPDVAKSIKDSRKIEAIKAFRNAVGIEVGTQHPAYTLKASKDAIDVLYSESHLNY